MQTTQQHTHRERELEDLLDQIWSGAIDRLDEMDERELALLHTLRVEGESLETLLDRLRGSDRDPA